MTGDTALLVEKLMQALTVVLHIQMHCTQLLLLHLQHLLQQVMASSILMTKSNLQLVQFSKIQHKVQDRESMVDVKVPPNMCLQDYCIHQVYPDGQLQMFVQKHPQLPQTQPLLA
jgi:hypothetical protein